MNGQRKAGFGAGTVIVGVSLGCLGVLMCGGVLMIGCITVISTAPADRNRVPTATPQKSNNLASDRRIEAWTMAERFVTERLKSPSTANFGGLLSGNYQNPEECVTSLGQGEYRVKGWVDSQNAFGATVRTQFVLMVKDMGDNKTWQMVGEPVMLQQ